MPPRTTSSIYISSNLRQCLYHPPFRRLTTNPQQSLTQPNVPSSKIPPESPNFVYVPRPLQPQAVPRPWMKGVLPVPRKLFPKNGPDKVDPAYLASATPEPLQHNTHKKHDHETAGFVSYKARQAERRRTNLRESLIELRYRKERDDRRVAARSARKQAFNHRQRNAPEREDERLTNATVLEADRVRRHTVLPDPDREGRLAMKTDNVVKHRAALEEERRNMLHTLYVNAGQFITTGAQLDQVVDRVFDDQAQFLNDQQKGVNIWNLGEPETVAELLGEKGKGEDKRKAVDIRGKRNLVEERMRRIGEELTGGRT